MPPIWERHGVGEGRAITGPITDVGSYAHAVPASICAHVLELAGEPQQTVGPLDGWDLTEGPPKLLRTPAKVELEPTNTQDQRKVPTPDFFARGVGFYASTRIPFKMSQAVLICFRRSSRIWRSASSFA